MIRTLQNLLSILDLKIWNDAYRVLFLETQLHILENTYLFKLCDHAKDNNFTQFCSAS